MSSHKDILQSMICFSEVTPPEWLCINKRSSPDQPQIIVTHIGVKQSLRRVFGSSWLKALLPIFTRWGSTCVAEGRPEFISETHASILSLPPLHTQWGRWNISLSLERVSLSNIDCAAIYWHWGRAGFLYSFSTHSLMVMELFYIHWEDLTG